MKNSLRKESLFKSAFVYTIINFVNKSFPFFLLPLFTRVFSLESYGAFSLYKAIINILIPIIGINMSEGIIRKYYEKKGDEFGEYISQSLFINLVSTIIIGICIIVVPAQIFQELIGVPKYLFTIAVFVSFFTCVNNIERGLLRCEDNNKTFAILVLGQSILYFLLIWCLYGFRILTVFSATIVESATYFVYFIVSLYFLNKKYNLKFLINLGQIKELLNYVVPLAINSILAYLFALSDRFIIGDKLGNDQVGIYNATFQVVSILQILAVSFNAAWHPWVLKNLSKGISKRKFNKIRVLIFLMFGVFSIIFCSILYQYLPFILGGKFVPGKQLIIWMSISVVFQFGYWLAAPVIQFYKRNWLLTISSFPAFLFSICMNFLYLHEFGLIFAAQVSAISWGIISLITLIGSQKMFLKYA